MARNICSQCHRVLCSSGVSGSQPASHPCYTIYTTNSELEWPKKSVYISGVPAEGHRDLYTSRQLCRQRPPTHSWGGQRNLYTFQECQQRATGTCIHLGNCAGKDLQHTAGGALEICIHFMSASRGPQKPVYISSAATPRLSKPNTMGPNQTLPTQTQHQPNQILSSKAKEKREKTSPTETAWSSTETKQVMDDLNLREELVKIIRTHIAKTEDIKMHQVSVLQKDTGNQTQT